MWKAPAAQALHCTALYTVAPRIRVAGGSFAIRVSFWIKLGGSGIPLPPNQTEAEEWKKECPLPICPPSLRKIRDCSIFHFLFFNFLATKSQVGGRQREKLVANGE